MKKIYSNGKQFLLLGILLLSCGVLQSQVTVTGTVFQKLDDGSTDTHPGANVVVKGTSIGAATDYDGKYQVQVRSKEDTLVFSAIGLETQEIIVGNKTTIDVVMQQQSVKLGDAVVIGYGKEEHENISVAATVLKGSDLAGRPNMSVDQSLQGRAAGVQVTANSGSPGSEMSIRIRGTGTIGDANPLYVVDGIPVGTTISLNPDDVESISILKDASATAIYGSRGANGVVIITTKGGGSIDGEVNTNLEFNAYKGTQSAWKKLDMCNAQEYFAIRNTVNPRNLYRWSELGEAGVEQDVNNPTYQENIKKIGEGTDWQDEIFRNAVVENYQLRYSGANKNSNYSIGGGYQNQEGIVLGTNFNKYNLGVKSSYKIFPKLTFGESIGISKTEKVIIDEGDMGTGVLVQALIADPTVSPRNDTTYNQLYNNGYNPLAIIEYEGRDSKDNLNNNFGTITGRSAGINLWSELEIVKGLSIRGQYSYNTWSNIKNHFMPKFTVGTYQVKENNSLMVTDQKGTNETFNSTATYRKTIFSADSSMKIHDFSIMAGIEYFEQMQTWKIDFSDDIPSDKLEQRYLIAGGSINIENIQGEDYKWSLPQPEVLYSQMGRITYGYKNRYLLTGTIRRDGSSKFGDNEKYGVFPSFSTAWKIHDEPFFKNKKSLKNINTCKLRLGWGIVGNQNIANFQYVTLVGTGADYHLGGEVVQGSALQALPNSYLHWEGQEQINAGLDFGLNKDKIILTADVFQKITKGMLVNVPIPAVGGGYENSYSNAASVENIGLELSGLYRKYEGEFHYSAGFSFTKVKNEVVSLGSNQSTPIEGGRIVVLSKQNATRTMEGYPIASFWGYKVDGIYQSWEEVRAGNQPNAQPGDFKYVDIDGDGKITNADQTVIGNPHPKFTFGTNFTADYKNFDIGMAFQGSYGNDIFNASKGYLLGNTEKNYLAEKVEGIEAWKDVNGDGELTDNEIVGSETITRIGAKTKNYQYLSSAFVEDGSYIRLKDITIGYTMPVKNENKMGLKNLRVYLRSQNLLTFTRYSGFDPEIGTNKQTNWEGPELGVDRVNYPQARSFIAGINLKF